MQDLDLGHRACDWGLRSVLGYGTSLFRRNILYIAARYIFFFSSFFSRRGWSLRRDCQHYSVGGNSEGWLIIWRTKVMLIICSEKMTARSKKEGALFKCWLLPTKVWEYHWEGAMDNVNTKCSQASSERWEEGGPNSSWKRHLRSLEEGALSSFWKRLYKNKWVQMGVG